MSRNVFNRLVLLCALLILSISSFADEISKSFDLMVFKTPTCGCCKKWLTHLERSGITAYSKDYQYLGSLKSEYGIEPQYQSCHTAVTRDGFAFEGHVPAKFIEQFLSESHSNAIGLSVPAMPIGSPGMEVGERFQPYNVLMLLNDGSSKIFATVNTYEEQF